MSLKCPLHSSAAESRFTGFTLTHLNFGQNLRIPLKNHMRFSQTLARTNRQTFAQRLCDNIRNAGPVSRENIEPTKVGNNGRNMTKAEGTERVSPLPYRLRHPGTRAITEPFNINYVKPFIEHNSYEECYTLRKKLGSED